MTRRRRLLLISAVACVLLALVVRWAMMPAFVPGVTLKNFDLLHNEMTVAEMTTILGPPEYSIVYDKNNTFHVWQDKWFSIDVSRVNNVNVGGRYLDGGVELRTSLPPPRGILCKIRRWVGL